MAARTFFTSLLMVAVTWAMCAQGQQFYVGPGTVVQSRVYGPYVQPVYPHAGPGPYVPNPFPLPPVYVPAPGPYVYGPMIVPPAYLYSPSPYQSGTYSLMTQPSQGYQPTGPAPRFGDPIVPPAPQARPTAKHSTPPPSSTAQPRVQPPKSEPADPKTSPRKPDPADKPAQQVMPAH
jgi:hypothetical protein